MQKNILLKFTLLLASSMTVMAGATIAPALPEIRDVFSDIPNALLITKLVLTMPAIFIAILAPIAGYIIDTFGRKHLLVCCSLLYLVSGSAGLFLNNIYWILVSRAILGIAVAGIMTTTTTLIADYFTGNERRRFMGFQGAFMSFGGVVFISIGGILADIGWRIPFAVYTLATILFIFTMLFIYEPVLRKNQEDSKPARKKIKWKLQTIPIIYIVAFLGFVFFFMIIVQMPFVLEHLLKISNTMIGITISVSILTGAVIALFYSNIKKHLSFPLIYTLTFFLMGSGFIIICLSNSYSLILIGLILQGAGTGMMMPNSNLWLVTLAPELKRGRIVGLLSTAVYLGQFLSPMIFEPISRLISMQNTFGTAGVFMLLMSASFVVLHYRQIKSDGITT